MKNPITCLVAAALSFAASSARAEPVQVEAARSAGPLALVAEIGEYDGLAAGLELRLARVGARVTGGVNFTGLTVSDADTHMLDSFYFFANGQINADAFAFPVRLANGAELGLSTGYRYNTLLGHGVAFALEARRQFGARIGARVSGGLAIFPDGTDRVIAERDWPSDVEFNFPFGAGLQAGVTLAMTYDLL